MNYHSTSRWLLRSLAVVMLGAWAITSHAQDGIFGIVIDTAGTPVPGANVVIMHEHGKVQSSVTTASDGKFRARGLTSGWYSVLAHFRGCASTDLLDVLVVATQRTFVTVALSEDCRLPQAGSGVYSKAQNSSASGGYYDDDLSLAPSPISSAADSAGYSSGADTDARSPIIEGTTRLSRDAGSFDPTKLRLEQAMTGESGEHLSQADQRIQNSRPEESEDPEEPGMPGCSSLEEKAILDRGAVLLARHAYVSAEKNYAAGLSCYPKSADLELGVGSALFLLNQYAESVQLFLSASDKSPADSMTGLFLAKVFPFASASEGGEIEMRLRRLVQYRPRDAFAHLYLAQALLSQLKTRDGHTSCSEVESVLGFAIALDPSLYEAHFLLGEALESDGALDKAIEEYRRAVTIRTDEADAHYRLARLLFRQGEYAEGQTEMKRFLQVREPK